MESNDDKPKKRFDEKKVKQFIETENKFIKDLFSKMAIPTRLDSDDESDVEDPDENMGRPTNLFPNKTSRANSISDLQERLDKVRGPKRNLSYKEKLEKKGLKNRIKKKEKNKERKMQKTLVRTEKMSQPKLEKVVSVDTTTPSAKPVYNSDGKMVFSKFDFTGIGTTKEKKTEKDPKKLLKSLQEQKEKLQKLEAEGNVEKATQIKEKMAWKSALAKAHGEKVRDDPELLKRSVKKQEQQQKKSKKKWEARVEGVKKAQEEGQKKRNENIEKRKKEKTTKKIKKAVKRGKVIPGF